MMMMTTTAIIMTVTWNEIVSKGSTYAIFLRFSSAPSVLSSVWSLIGLELAATLMKSANEGLLLTVDSRGDVQLAAPLSDAGRTTGERGDGSRWRNYFHFLRHYAAESVSQYIRVRSRSSTSSAEVNYDVKSLRCEALWIRDVMYSATKEIEYWRRGFCFHGHDNVSCPR